MSHSEFECRPDCGACCIIPSISSAIPGMPDGKPANTKCIHLTDDFKCGIFGTPSRPRVCSGFKAEYLVCGNNAQEATVNLAWMEGITTPENKKDS